MSAPSGWRRRALAALSVLLLTVGLIVAVPTAANAADASITITSSSSTPFPSPTIAGTFDRGGTTGGSLFATVTVNGGEACTSYSAGPTGTFSCALTSTLNVGDNSVAVTLYSDSGTITRLASATQTLTYTPVSPSVTITSSGSTTVAMPTIEGVYDFGSWDDRSDEYAVEVRVGSSVACTISVSDSSGTYSCSLPTALAAGANTVTVQFGSPSTPFDTATQTLTYTAPVQYEVTLDLQGGATTNGVSLVRLVDSSTGFVPTTSVALVGSVFGGWTTQSDGGGTFYLPGGKVVPSQAMTLYALWKPNITVSFDLNGGSGTAPAPVVGTWVVESQAYRATLPSVPSVTEPGKRPDPVYWYLGPDGGASTYRGGATANFSGSSNVTLYLRWFTTANVTFDTNGGTFTGGTTTGSRTADVGGFLKCYQFVRRGIVTELTRPGYTLLGMNSAADGSGSVSCAWLDNMTVPATDVVMYAQWLSTTSSTIAYDSNGGTGAIESQTYTDGTAVPAAVIADGSGLARTGYALTGWNTTSTGTGTSYAAGASIRPLADVTLYAQWALVPLTPDPATADPAIEITSSATATTARPTFSGTFALNRESKSFDEFTLIVLVDDYPVCDESSDYLDLDALTWSCQSDAELDDGLHTVTARLLYNGISYDDLWPTSVDTQELTVSAVEGATITGHVFNDVNGNGVQDANEPDVSNVTVELWRMSESGTSVFVSSTVTHSPYVFTGVSPGTYQVRVPAGTKIAGYAPLTSAKVWTVTVTGAGTYTASASSFGLTPTGSSLASTGVDAAGVAGTALRVLMFGLVLLLGATLVRRRQDELA